MTARQEVAASLKQLGHKVEQRRLRRMLRSIGNMRKHLHGDRRIQRGDGASPQKPGMTKKQLDRVAKAARQLRDALDALTDVTRKAVEPVIINRSVFDLGSRLTDLQAVAHEFKHRGHPRDLVLRNYLNGCAHMYWAATREWPRHFYDHDKQSMSSGHPFFSACLKWAGEDYAPGIVREVIEQHRPRKTRGR